MYGALPKPPEIHEYFYFAENCVMNRSFFPLIAFVLPFLFVFSCAGFQGPNKAPPETAVEKPERPVLIMGKGLVGEENMALFLLRNNPQADGDFVRKLARFYTEEAAFEGINHDVAFSQMCLETGFLSYGGLVQPEWNNFCGLGAIGPEQPGLVFSDPRTGVRAHIQHLKAYATEEPLKGELVDPRYKYVRKGSSPVIEGLSGTWAADKLYSVKISSILQRLYEFSF
jgi:hypothetical protein